MSNIKTSAFAACLLLSASANHLANAAVSGSISLTDIQITLQDLNPADSTAAYFNVESTPRGSALYAVANDYDYNVVQSQSGRSTDGWLSPVSYAVTAPVAQASAAVGSNFISFSGATLQDGGVYLASGSAPDENNFTLGAFSSIHIRGLASIQLDIDARTAINQIPYIGADMASGYLYISMYASDGLIGDYASIGKSFGGPSITHDAFHYQESKWVDIELINNSADTLTGQFTIGSALHGSAALAVPEPSSVALLIAGVAVGGVAQRRRQARI